MGKPARESVKRNFSSALAIVIYLAAAKLLLHLLTAANYGLFVDELYYLACGLLAVLGQVLVDPNSTVPMIGASGAISGVLAGYMTLFPHARVLTLVPIFIFIHFMEVPAGIFIILWFVMQLALGYMSLGAVSEGAQGVAWFAHIGGFLGGLILIRLLYRKPKGRRALFR